MALGTSPQTPIPIQHQTEERISLQSSIEPSNEMKGEKKDQGCLLRGF
jgi:hypothetical protein